MTSTSSLPDETVEKARIVAALNSLLHTGDTSPHWPQGMRRGAHALAESLCLTLGIELTALRARAQKEG